MVRATFGRLFPEPAAGEAKTAIDELLQKFFNQAASEHRAQLNSIMGVGSGKDGIAIRTKLKVLQAKSAGTHDESSFNFMPKQLRLLDEADAHMLMRLVAKHAPTQLQRASLPLLKALFKGYTANEGAYRALALPVWNRENKPALADTLAKLIGEADGFARFDAHALGAAQDADH